MPVSEKRRAFCIYDGLDMWWGGDVYLFVLSLLSHGFLKGAV